MAEGQELQDLDLAGRERLGLAVALLGLGQLLGQGHHELGVDHHVAARHQANRLDQMLGIARLEHVAAGSRPNGLHHELPVVVGGQHDRAHVGEALPDHPGGLQAVDPGHPDVEQHDVGLLLLDHRDGLLAVRGLADDIDVLGHVEVAAQALTDERVVVGNEDPDAHALPPDGRLLGKCAFHPRGCRHPGPGT